LNSPRTSTVAGYVFLIAGLIAPFVLALGTHMVISLMLCAAGLVLIVVGASTPKGRGPRNSARRRAARPRTSE
jgi:hypothetical protein